MRKILLTLVVIFLNLILVMSTVDAARLGGGRTLGRQIPNYSRQVPKSPAPSYAPRSTPDPNYAPQRSTTPPPMNNTPPAASRSRWLGPLAGLVAGGLLASLFFGHGFDGLQFLDILLIIGLGVGIYFLIRYFRNRQLPPIGENFSAASAADNDHFSAAAGAFNPRIMGGGAAQPLDAAHLAWFNEENFLQNARTYYLRLQASWDAGRMEEIAEYVTPELYRELAQQRATLGQNFTEVVQLNVEFLGLAKEGNTIFAGVRYSGLIREQQDAPPHQFSEIWHIQRSLSESNANWYIAGIQQN